MNRAEKRTFVSDFRDKVQEAPVLYLTDFSGLDVKSMTLLRRRLRDSGAEYLVVKNRLVKLAVADLDMPDISEALLGPTGVVLGYEGVVEPAKVVSDFAKEHDDKPVFKLGILDKKVVSAVEIERLANQRASQDERGRRAASRDTGGSSRAFCRAKWAVTRGATIP